MSTNLFLQTGKKKCLPKGLKYLIAPRLWGHDGTLGAEPTIVNCSNLDYFQGILDVLKSDDVRKEALQEIVDAINKYDEAILSLEG